MVTFPMFLPLHIISILILSEIFIDTFLLTMLKRQSHILGSMQERVRFP